MHARSSTFRGRPEHLARGIGYVRATGMPSVLQLEGCVGLSTLADPASGRCIATTSWANAAAMHDSRDGVRPVREHTAELLGGEPEIQEWEIVLLHRLFAAPAGACVRLVWHECLPDAVDDAIDAYRMTMLDGLEDLSGFCSISLLVARTEGRAVSAITFVDRATMERARDRALGLSQQFTTSTGVVITDSGEFDLVLPHLRVPETL